MTRFHAGHAAVTGRLMRGDIMNGRPLGIIETNPDWLSSYWASRASKGCRFELRRRLDGSPVIAVACPEHGLTCK